MKTYGTFADPVLAEKRRLTKIAEALDQLDSHGIYARGTWSDLLAKAGIDIEKLPSNTSGEIRRQIIARRLGGSVDETKERLYSGYMVSAAVVRQLGHEPDGDKLYGRGSAHHANIEQIRKLAEL